MTVTAASETGAVDGHRATDRDRRNQHRLLDPTHAAQPENEVLAAERSQALSSALDGLEPAEREALVAHSDGVSITDLADRDSTTPGAVAARLARSRARLRVDYVIACARCSCRRSCAGRCCWRCRRATCGANAPWTPPGTWLVARPAPS